MGFACLFLLSVFLCVVMDAAPLWQHRLDPVVYCFTSGDGHSVLLRSDTLRDEEEIILEAIDCFFNHSDKEAVVEWSSKRLRGDRDMAEVVLEKSGTALRYLSASLREDTDIVMFALETSWHAFKHLPSSLRSDHMIAMKALRHADIEALSFVGDTLRDDQAFITEAIMIEWYYQTGNF